MVLSIVILILKQPLLIEVSLFKYLSIVFCFRENQLGVANFPCENKISGFIDSSTKVVLRFLNFFEYIVFYQRSFGLKVVLLEQFVDMLSPEKLLVLLFFIVNVSYFLIS
jgi:hypothetical protein